MEFWVHTSSRLGHWSNSSKMEFTSLEKALAHAAARRRKLVRDKRCFAWERFKDSVTDLFHAVFRPDVDIDVEVL